MREMTCIVCPMGCRMRLKIENGLIKVEGNGCRRGELYAKDEVTVPKRVVTSIVAVDGGLQMLPVKTAGPVPKELIFNVMEEIRQTSVRGKVEIGQVVREDLAGTGVALIATKSIK